MAPGGCRERREHGFAAAECGGGAAIKERVEERREVAVVNLAVGTAVGRSARPARCNLAISVGDICIEAIEVRSGQEERREERAEVAVINDAVRDVVTVGVGDIRGRAPIDDRELKG